MKKPYMASVEDAYQLSAAQLSEQGYDGAILQTPNGTVYIMYL